ncbi:hypothetical protein [Craterilacuibacter sinensis]|uniref:DUF4136 domain-containing protein n=1 Tax=Craterilacuibacter sinensis TaxID=2686017 RepID=A0A845BNY2_9NEIS|nr:hypothetical protein [Craterilacuibacter sinensis]MXR36964.1 hypothetical protein [Craterilacuibacter sinensis]
MKYLALLPCLTPLWGLADTMPPPPVATASLSCPAPVQLGFDAKARLELLLSLHGYTPLAQGGQWQFCFRASTRTVLTPQTQWQSGIGVGYGRYGGGWGGMADWDWPQQPYTSYAERTLNTLTLSVSKSGSTQMPWQAEQTVDSKEEHAGSWQRAALLLLDQVPQP